MVDPHRHPLPMGRSVSLLHNHLNNTIISHTSTHTSMSRRALAARSMALPIIAIKRITRSNILEAARLPTVAAVPFAALGKEPTVGVFGDDAFDAFGVDKVGDHA